MKKSVLILLAACAASVSLAGSKFTGSGNVTIAQAADGSGTASGYLGHIYNGPAMKQWIACQRNESDSVFCHAMDETRTISVFCWTTSAFLAQSISSISPDARLTFSWNASNTCTRITISHSSEFQDKQG